MEGVFLFIFPTISMSNSRNENQSRLESSVDFGKVNGLLPVIVQSAQNLRVVYQCLLDKESFYKSLKRDPISGVAEEDDARLDRAFLDCDGDAALFQVRYPGAEGLFGPNVSDFSSGESVEFRDEQELLPVTIQQSGTCEVLMHAYMNQLAYNETVDTGFVNFYSRSRKKLWKKGETSGNTQKLENILFDSERRNILVLADQIRAACHTGYRSCFYREIARDGKLIPFGEPLFDPNEVYRK